MTDEQNIVRALAETNFWGRDIDTGIYLPEYVEKIKKFLESAIVPVIGPRRSGKTTICMQVLESFIKGGFDKSQTLYVNFEDPAFEQLASGTQGIDTIYRSYRTLVNAQKPAIMFLDEIQNVPGWEKWVRTAKEKDKALKIIVTGSSSKLLSSEIATTLTGRTITVTVFPLSFRNFMRFKGVVLENPHEIDAKRDLLKSLFLEYMKFGGFPAVVIQNDEFTKKAMLKEYFDGVVFRDIVKRYRIKDIDTIRNTAELCINSLSSLVSATKMRESLVAIMKRKISPNKVVSSFGQIESSFLLFFVPIFSSKVREQKLYPKKVYSVDTGMANSISIKFSSDTGRLAENIVFLNLRRHLDAGQIFYWRDEAQREVDFAVKTGLKISELIQVSWDPEEAGSREKDALIRAMQEFGLNTGIVVTGGFEDEENHGKTKIRYVPIWKWLIEYGEKLLGT